MISASADPITLSMPISTSPVASPPELGVPSIRTITPPAAL